MNTPNNEDENPSVGDATGPLVSGLPSDLARGKALSELVKAASRLANSKTSGQWRRIVRKLVGFEGLLFNPEAPCRRVEGAFGSYEDSGTVAKVAVIADISTNITAQMLYSYLADLSTFSKIADINMAQFRYFCFFYRAECDEVSAAWRYTTAIKKSFPSIGNAFVKGSALAGATNLSNTLKLVKGQLGTRANVMLVFTSGRLGDEISDTASKFLYSMRKKTTWVLPDGVQEVDDAFKHAAADAIAKQWVVSSGGEALFRQG